MGKGIFAHNDVQITRRRAREADWTSLLMKGRFKRGPGVRIPPPPPNKALPTQRVCRAFDESNTTGLDSLGPTGCHRRFHELYRHCFTACFPAYSDRRDASDFRLSTPLCIHSYRAVLFRMPQISACRSWS